MSPPELPKPKHEINISVWFGPRDGGALDSRYVNPVDAEPAPIEQKTNLMSLVNIFLISLLLLAPLAGDSPKAGAAPSNSSPAIPRQGSTLYDPAEPYDVNLPVYPVSYTEEQKQAQRAAGIALVEGVNDAVRAQRSEYRAEPGVYRLPKGANFNISRLGAFTLHLPNCEIIMECVEKPLFPLWKVGSFSIVGPVKVDADPLPCSQGRIVVSDYERRRITVDILPG